MVRIKRIDDTFVALFSTQTPDRRRPGSNSWQNPGPSVARAHGLRLPCRYASVARLCPVLRGSMRTSRTSYRLYSCRLCVAQVRICSDCDRGNQYCADGCAGIRRRESMARAGVRFQLSPRGARLHAARQSAWRARRIQKVTHQGSVSGVDAAIVVITSTPPEEPDADPAPPSSATQRWPRRMLLHPCSFCWRPLPAFARSGPLRGGP